MQLANPTCLRDRVGEPHVLEGCSWRNGADGEVIRKGLTNITDITTVLEPVADARAKGKGRGRPHSRSR